MKTKYTVITIIAVLGLAATLFAAEQHKADVTKVIILKSHGVAIAELRLLKGSSPVEVRGQKSNYDAMTGNMTASGGVTIMLDSAVTVKADEMEMMSVEK